MKVFKWGEDLAVCLPAEAVERLSLKDGDEVDVQIVRRVPVSELKREEALARIRALAIKLPSDWKFDRDEANSG